MDEAYWTAARTMRLRIADFLDRLSPAGWDAVSLCQGWRVRDVNEWTVGAGPEIAVPALSLVLLLTGRTSAAIDALHGSAVATLKT